MDPLTFPTEPADDAWLGFLTDRADADLQRARDVVDELKDGTSRTPEQVLELWNDGDIALHNSVSLAGVLTQMHPSEAVRTASEERELAGSRFATERGLDRELYDVLVAASEAGTDLDADSRRLIEHTLRDFRRSGVDRDDATRDRLREIAERSTVVGQDFSRNIRDAVGRIRVTPEQLAGLPEDFKAAHPPEDDGLITITTDYPDLLPFRAFARDAAARRGLHIAAMNRAWPENDPLLHELLDLRAEQAELLGYADWPDYDTEIKMIGTGAAIGEFIDRIAALTDESAHRDYDVLLERLRRDRPEATEITSADASYYAELVRRERFEVDAQEVRQYFEFDKVRAGLLEVTGRLFGLRYVAADVPVWHPDVVAYDVESSETGERYGRIYLDLHPREGKYKHAAQFDLVAGVTDRQLAEGVLACNFSRGLMEHSDVVTIFHEFGHLVHHVLAGRQRWVRFSGVATEWDFVEAPSQLLEEWAWDADILRSFATDADGNPIPVELVQRMQTAKDFGEGYFARTQMSYAAVSYVLHRDRPADLTAAVVELQRKYSLFPPLPDTHFQDSFGHLEGYSSAYYTYMWSLVIAKDLFSAFNADDLFDPAVAHRYRDEILARGGSDDAAALVENFLGRPYSFDAFGAWLDQSAAKSR